MPSPTTSSAKPSSGWAAVAAYLVRARLCYGEWLRRTKRRAEARTQLRRAFDAFATMGANAFAERARRELVATGENLRRQRVNDGAELTPQEQEIAQLASARRTNPEIGAELFLSARTVNGTCATSTPSLTSPPAANSTPLSPAAAEFHWRRSECWRRLRTRP
jgi:DNA-binding CsgD family transcriptional regulator